MNDLQTKREEEPDREPDADDVPTPPDDPARGPPIKEPPSKQPPKSV